MQNPWKLTTLLLAGALLLSSARAETTNWKQDALAHLEKASELLSTQGGGNKTGKTAPTDRAPEKSKADASPATKALQLTRAAIVQLKRAE